MILPPALAKRTVLGCVAASLLVLATSAEAAKARPSAKKSAARKAAAASTVPATALPAPGTSTLIRRGPMIDPDGR